MIIDTSALVAVLRQEHDAQPYALALSVRDEPRRMSAANYLETAIVMDSTRDIAVSHALNDLIEEAGITLESVDTQHARIARLAYRHYGKGSGHPAQLNFGDCFAYALAQTTGERLLFKGEDFRKTDVAAYLP